MERGHQVVADKAVQVTRRLDVRLNVMPHYPGVIKNRQRVHVHHAGREVLARLVLLDQEAMGGPRARARVWSSSIWRNPWPRPGGIGWYCASTRP